MLTKHTFFFWFCWVGTIINLALFAVTQATPKLQDNAQVFLMSAVLFAVGAFANYMNARQAENDHK